MPVITLSMRRGRTPEEKSRLVDCVRGALKQAFQMEDDSYSVRLLEFSPEDFYLPPPKTGRYLLVEVDCFPGRTVRQKEVFSAALFSLLEQAGEDPGQALTLIREPPMENWGYRGKKSLLPRALKWYYHTTIL